MRPPEHRSLGAGSLRDVRERDRVVTNGGIYGSVAKVNGNTVHLQIAEKVRIELAKNAIVGYQGQESLADTN